MFVHARNETVRTASVLCEMAKNSGQIMMFAAEKSSRSMEALKQVQFLITYELTSVLLYIFCLSFIVH